MQPWRKALVVGAAKSGIAAALFLRQKGVEVTLCDIKTAAELEESLKEYDLGGVELFAGGYPPVKGKAFDLVVMSPGVPLTVPPVKEAREEGIPVISELELAYRYARAPIVAVTGTNGKTTTTSLIGELMKTVFPRVLVGGNIGRPLVTEVEEYGPEDVIVAEVSSFQLETTDQFRPRVAVILNITPDHLDRHGTMEGYREAKARIFARQEREDFTVLNYDDPLVRPFAERTRGEVIFFSRRHKLEKGVFVAEDTIFVRACEREERVLPAAQLKIRGSHNLENALAATAAAWAMGVPVAEIARVLREFKGVAHRMEPVAEIDGVLYVNDSKGTNPDAAIKALDSYFEPIVLIAGGRNKGSSFAEFARKIKEKVRFLILIGEAAPEIKEAVLATGFTSIVEAGSLEEAVALARKEARPGEVVLLSPACASWDMFKNYEERGDLFRQAVLSLQEREKR
ncbi:MAG: UDP-N-acetylmuramoylalanine--D-glutamate ligase [Eubacteriales bacterium]|nr:UDP-N-acetylmuramoylalanine--D-glutamate ligase [Eubacteriales bacterium]